MNNVALVGRLTKDPELRYTQTGKAVANFTVAVNRPFKNAHGEQEADFINCNSWGKPAENLANYMSKGSQIGVTGRIQTRSFENQEGNRIFVTDVVAENVEFLEPRKQNQQPQKQNESQSSINRNKDTFQNNGEPIDINDQDLPF